MSRKKNKKNAIICVCEINTICESLPTTIAKLFQTNMRYQHHKHSHFKIIHIATYAFQKNLNKQPANNTLLRKT